MKVWLIVAASLIVVGLILFAVVIGMNRFDIKILNTQKYVSNTHEVVDDFHSISLVTDTADVDFVLSTDGVCRVECYEEENATHAVTVEDGTLTVTLQNKKKWYQYIHIGISSAPKLTVALPQAEYEMLVIKENTGDVDIPADFRFQGVEILSDTGDVRSSASVAEAMKIKTSTGNIEVKNASFGALGLSVTTGKITVSSVTCAGDIDLHVSTGKAILTDVSCQNFSSHGDTGELRMTNVIANARFSIVRSTGDVRFEACDAAEITVTTDTGDVRGTLCSDKIFFTHTDTGRVEVPQSMAGGKCEITTDTGDIRIEIQA